MLRSTPEIKIAPLLALDVIIQSLSRNAIKLLFLLADDNIAHGAGVHRGTGCRVHLKPPVLFSYI